MKSVQIHYFLSALLVMLLFSTAQPANGFTSDSESKSITYLNESSSGAGNFYIFEHPQDIDASIGDTVYFYIGIEGQAVNYQWLKDNIPVLGANSQSLAIEGVQPTDMGSYRCIVSDMFGVDTSMAGYLNIVTIDSGLVHHFPFENHGNDLKGNWTINNMNGTTYAPLSSYNYSSSIYMNPASSKRYAATTDSVSMDFSSPMSISAWFKWNGTNFMVYSDRISGGQTNTEAGLLCQYDYKNDGTTCTVDGDRFWSLRLNQNNRSIKLKINTYGCGSSSHSLETPNNVFQANTWHNVIFTSDGWGSVKIYVDGSLEASTYSFPYYNAHWNRILEVGRYSYFYYSQTYPDNHWHSYFPGYIDDIKIWDRTLSPNEINNYVNSFSAPLQGTYSIGQSGAEDFFTFNEAVYALKTNGIAGPVTFNVNSGTYNETLNIPHINGSSPQNSITFQSLSGDSTDVVLSSSLSSLNGYAAIILDSASNINFRDMTISGTFGSTYNYNYLIKLENNCKNISFTDNILEVPYRNNDRTHIISSSANQQNGLIVSNNLIKNGYRGIYIYGSSGLSQKNIYVDGNKMLGQQNVAIHTFYADSVEILNNIIRTANNAEDGITCSNTSNISNIANNIIKCNPTSSFTGIDVYNSLGSTSGRIKLFNNYISIKSNNTSNQGIAINNSDYIDVYFNTVYIRNTGANTICLASSAVNSDILNNNLVNTAGGKAINLSVSSGPNVDNNNIYTTGSTLAYYNASYSDINSIHSSTTYDISSISINPLFENDTSYVFTKTDLDGKGTPISGIDYDIEGNTRHSTNPDIGAYESIVQAPTSISVPFTTESSAQIDWVQPGLAAEWQIEYGHAQFNQGSGTLVSVYSQPHLINHLDMNASYDVYVRAITFMDTSAWTGPFTFYTASYCNPLSGVYYISDTSTYFNTFEHAITKLSNCGVSGPVTFKVQAGTYNEQITIPKISGAAESNPIKFEGYTEDSTDVILTYSPASSSENFVVKFDSTTSICLKHMTIQNNSLNFGRTIHVADGCGGLYIENCQILGKDTAELQVNAEGIYNAATDSFEFLEVRNNYFKYSSKAISISANIGQGDFKEIEIDGNYFEEIEDTYLELNNVRTFVIRNYIYVNSNYTGTGDIIKLNAARDTSYFHANRMVSVPNINSFVKIQSSTPAPTDVNVICNNFVNMKGNGTAFELDNARYIDIVYNNFNMQGNTGECIKSSSGSSNIEIKNNIFKADNNIKAINFASGDLLQTCDHNCYDLSSAIAQYGGSSYTTLSSWKTQGFGHNSITTNINYYSDTELRTSNAVLNGNAVFDNLIPIDIDWENRDAMNPDIGADEFDLQSKDAMALDVYTSGQCEGMQDIIVKVLNNGANTIYVMQINYAIDGAAPSTYNWTGTLSSADTAEVLIPNAFNASSSNTYKLNATIMDVNGSADANSMNDTISRQGITFFAAPDASISNLTPDYCASSPSITLSANPGGGTFKVNDSTQTIFDPSQNQGFNQISYEVTNMDGCTGYDTVYTTVHTSYFLSENVTACDNQPFYWRGNTYTSTGIFYDSLQSVNGCDSIFELVLTMNPGYFIQENHTTCDNQPYMWHGQLLSSAGVYYDSLTTTNGCDSVFELTLNVNFTYFIPESHSMCENESYSWHGNVYSSPGVYYDSLKTVAGCDSIYELSLNTNPTYTIYETKSICDNESYSWHGNTYTSPGIYYDSLQSVNGCDSIYELTLIVNPTYFIQETHTICDNEYYLWHGSLYTSQGVYYDSIKTTTGCDSIFELTLNVEPSYLIQETHTMCADDSYFWHGQSYNSSGVYYDSLVTDSGCDSIYMLTLTVNPLPLVFILPSVDTAHCANDPAVSLDYYPLGGNLSGPGLTGDLFIPDQANTGNNEIIYQYTDMNGCANSDTINITVHNPPTVTHSALLDICASQQQIVLSGGNPTGGIYSGDNVNSNQSKFYPALAGSGTHQVVYTYTDANGCSNADTLYQKVTSVPTSTFSVTPYACLEDTITVTYTGNAGINAVFNWNFGNANIVSGAGEGPYQIHYPNTGIKAITLDVTDSSCTSITTTNSVSIESSSAYITAVGDTNVCYGEVATLFANTGQGYSFQWYDSTGILANDTLSYLNAAQSGKYYCQVTTPNSNCTSFSNTIEVVVKDQITSDFLMQSSSCKGDTIIITFDGVAPMGAVYNWDFDNAIIVTGSGGGPYEVYWTTDGMKTVSLEITEGNCASQITAHNIQIRSVPAIITALGDTSFCQGESVSLLANTGTNYSYMWKRDQLEISGATNSFYVATLSGNYSVQVTDNNSGCMNESKNIQVIANSTNFGLDFTATPTSFSSPPFNTAFTNNTPNPNNYYWNWYLGDGNTSAVLEPTHTYVYDGDYDVKLIAQDIQTGCYDTLLKPAYISCQGGNVDPCVLDPEIIAVGPTIVCPDDSVLLKSQQSIPTATYQWLRNGTLITGANDSTYYAKQNGIFQLLMSDSICTKYSSPMNITHYQTIIPEIDSIGEIVPCTNDSMKLFVKTFFNSYQWSTGDTTESIYISASNDYTVTTTDMNGCKTVSQPYTVNASLLLVPEICIVGVDPNNHNRIIYERDANPLIDSFKVYRESIFAGQYDLIESKGADEVGIVIDTASNPQAKAYRYKITAVDTCGMETPPSPHHKSIHLTINAGLNGTWNLIWDEYHGFFYGTYKIYRGTNTSNITLLTQLPATATSYTDVNPPSGDVFYQIEVVKPGGCYPDSIYSKANTNYNSSRSNVADNTNISPIYLTAEFDANVKTGQWPVQINFYDQSSGFPASWKWDFGDGNTSIEQNPSHTYNNTGLYDVKLIANNGTYSDTIIKYDFINVLPNGMVEIGAHLNARIYPNPNNGNFTLDINCNHAGDASLNIFNNLGQIVFRDQLELNKKTTKELKLDHLPKGIYHVQLTSEKGLVHRQKVVIQ